MDRGVPIGIGAKKLSFFKTGGRGGRKKAASLKKKWLFQDWRAGFEMEAEKKSKIRSWCIQLSLYQYGFVFCQHWQNKG